MKIFTAALQSFKMADFCEFLKSEGQKQFEKAVYLCKEASKNDPEEEPYKSHYEAREILLNLRTKCSDFLNESPSDKKISLAISCIELHLGSNFTDTDETSTGEEYLSTVLKNLEDRKLEDQVISVYLHTLNHLGILWSARNRYDKAKGYLDQAEELFYEYKNNVGTAPMRADEMFMNIEEDENELLRNRAQKFESTLTHTFYYKAQVMAKTGAAEESAQYCHTTLRRQLDCNDYDPTDWALNAATLSQVKQESLFME